MGNWYSTYIGNPAGMPDYHKPPTFDPMYGFPNGRKERGMKVFLKKKCIFDHEFKTKLD